MKWFSRFQGQSIGETPWEARISEEIEELVRIGDHDWKEEWDRLKSKYKKQLSNVSFKAFIAKVKRTENSRSKRASKGSLDKKNPWYVKSKYSGSEGEDESDNTEPEEDFEDEENEAFDQGDIIEEEETDDELEDKNEDPNFDPELEGLLQD